MQRKEAISQELIALSPLIAQMEKINVFSVPAGYFDSVSDTIMACLKEEYPPLLATADNLSIPSGYFDNLPGSIMARIKAQESAQEEIKDLSPLLHSIQGSNVFEVPKGYFEEAPATVLNKLLVTNATEEIKRLSPLLYDLKSANVYDVPLEYFNDLPGIVTRKVQRGQANIIQMPWRRRLTGYAAAAMLAGAIIFGIYKSIDSPPAALSSNIPAAAIDTSIEKGTKMDDKQFNETLNSLPAADIVLYLEKNGDISDIAVLGNIVDDNALPDEEDYLTDEQTLENYLDQIEISTLKN